MKQLAITLKPDVPCDLGARLTLLVTELADNMAVPGPQSADPGVHLLITRHRSDLIVLTSHDPLASWRQYEFWYLGARPSEVRLSIRRKQDC